MRRAITAAVACLAACVSLEARAGSFDSTGRFLPDPNAVVSVDFEHPPQRYLPTDIDPNCVPDQFTKQTGDDALEGSAYVRLKVVTDTNHNPCADRFQLALPPVTGSYKANVWVRHGAIAATFVVVYTDASALGLESAQLAPTGRTTSDGWVELTTNDVPIDGANLLAGYIRVSDYSSVAGVDIDAIEVVRSGVYLDQRGCAGLGDPICTAEETCIHNRCSLGALQVPPLPTDDIRNDVVDMLESRLRVFYGGTRSRSLYLPTALATMETMRTATTAWQFWNTWATAIHQLHDWHTDTYGGLGAYDYPQHRLNACFIEGDADLSHALWPKDAKYADVLVSHTGNPETASGLHAGDRLVAVDGMHPLAWVGTLASTDWGVHVATDPNIFSDYAEELGGPYWTGGARILEYAHEFTVIRCDGATGTCASEPETIQVATLDNVFDSTADVACDNRPLYHFTSGNPDPTNHYVFGSFFRGQIEGTTAQEAIYGMVWDTLYGPDPGVKPAIDGAIADWKASARGVILDHRAGNGGTLDMATEVTTLARPPSTAAIIRMPMEIAGVPGADDPTAGLALFQAYKVADPYPVGDANYAVDLPIALVLHRDGSASDYMPFGMKGAPKTRLFGPHPTSGAFSTFINYLAWGLTWQVASGDTIAADGTTLIGHGVEPDETILPRQSDLLAGKDTLFEAALAWVRTELKP